MYLVFDTETTGKANFAMPSEHPSQPRLVQLGAQLLDTDFHVRAEMNMIVRPDGFVIPDDAAAVHGITQADAEAYGFEEYTVLNAFAVFCKRASHLVAHNIQYDGIVMGRAYAIRGVEVVLPPEKFCTMLAMTTHCNLPGGRNGQPKWPSLQEAHLHATGHDFVGAHDAMADVRACATVLRWLKTRDREGAPTHVPTATPNNRTANKNPVKPVPAESYTDETPMPFGKYRGTPLGKVPISWFEWYADQDRPSDLLLHEYAKKRA